MSKPTHTTETEYLCDGSTTHYQGCNCHEARRNAEIDALRAENAQLKETIEGPNGLNSYKHRVSMYLDVIKAKEAEITRMRNILEFTHEAIQNSAQLRGVSASLAVARMRIGSALNLSDADSAIKKEKI